MSIFSLSFTLILKSSRRAVSIIIIIIVIIITQIAEIAEICEDSCSNRINLMNDEHSFA